MKIGYCISLNELEQLECKMADFVDLSGCELTALSMRETYKIAERLKELEIGCIGIHAAFPGELKIAGKGADPDIAVRYFKELVKRASILQVKYIGIGSPQSRILEESDDREEADFRLAGLLRSFCGCAGEIMVLVESVNRTETNYINSLEEAYGIVSRVGRKNVGLILDLYHFLAEKEVMSNISDEIWKSIRYLHIADPLGRKYPGYATEVAVKHYFQKAVVKTENVNETAIEGNAVVFRKDMKECNEVMKMWIKETVLC